MTAKPDKILYLLGIAQGLEGRPYKVGVKLPRTAIEQAMTGKKVALKNIKEGDLVFMKGELGRYNKYFPQGIGHVGIYLGGGKVIHAERRRITGKYVDIYHPELIREAGKVVIEDLNKLIKRKKPLIVIKRYI